MSKPFNFEQFKAGKPAVMGGVIFTFRFEDNNLFFPIVCTCEKGSNNNWVESYKLSDFENATMLPTKRTVWIAICKHGEQNLIEPDDVFYNSKDEAMNSRHDGAWKVIDAIPYEIEE